MNHQYFHNVNNDKKKTMYTEYWQLQTMPFGSGANTELYYPSESHQGALLKLRYVVDSRGTAAVLAGRPGIGKTLLVHKLHEQLSEENSPVVHLVFPQMTGRDLLAYIAEKFNAPKEQGTSDTIEESVSRIETFLEANAAAGKHAVLIVDEADLLEKTDAVETLRLLTNFEFQGQPNLTLILVGQPGLLSLVSRRPQLEERVVVKTLLRPFTSHETAAYVQHRLQAAGTTREIFDDSALEVLHALSRGVPRSIGRLCDLALLIGFAEGLPTLSGEHIEAVSNELVTISPE